MLTAASLPRSTSVRRPGPRGSEHCPLPDRCHRNPHRLGRHRQGMPDL